MGINAVCPDFPPVLTGFVHTWSHSIKCSFSVISVIGVNLRFNGPNIYHYLSFSYILIHTFPCSVFHKTVGPSHCHAHTFSFSKKLLGRELVIKLCSLEFRMVFRVCGKSNIFFKKNRSKHVENICESNMYLPFYFYFFI